MSGDPIYDFAWWDLTYSSWLPTEWLWEGYYGIGTLGKEDDIKLHLYRIHWSLGLSVYYAEQNNREELETTIRNLQKDLIYFQESGY
jgi:hypothetical protein